MTHIYRKTMYMSLILYDMPRGENSVLTAISGGFLSLAELLPHMCADGNRRTFTVYMIS